MKRSIDYITRIAFYSAISIFIGALANCGDDSESSGGGSCNPPIHDGAINELSGNCRVADEEEHIRLEGLQIGSDQKVTVWAKAADSRGDSGLRLEIDDTNIRYENLGGPGSSDDSGSIFEMAHGGLGGGALCFDLHYEEEPIHLLAWKGSECNSSKTGDEGEALFNLEDDSRTGNDIESQNSYLYRIEGATVTLIRTGEPLFEE